MAFYSESLHGPKLNYPIHYKELLAVIRALKISRPELVGTRNTNPFTVVTDHRPLEHFMTKRLLKKPQANWANILSEHNCEFTYRPGIENTIADSLSRKAAELRNFKVRQEDENLVSIYKKLMNLPLTMVKLQI